MNGKFLRAKSCKLKVVAGGFTLIEIMVAVAVFSVVMLVAAGSLLVVLDANRKAQALQSAMTNLNFAVESMIRNMRVGTTYRCRSGGGPDPLPTGPIDSPRDCENGGNLVAFEAWNGNPANANDQIVYRYHRSSGGTEVKALERCTRGASCGQSDFARLTSPEIKIEDMEFVVRGTQDSDEQPIVIVNIRGTAGEGRTETEFSLQGTASQRVLDVP